MNVQLSKSIDYGDVTFHLKANKDRKNWNNGLAVSSGLRSHFFIGTTGDEVRAFAKRLMEVSLELDALIAEANK